MSRTQRRRAGTALVAGIILTGFGIQAGADTIYRWVDGNGVVNYTQQKPRDADAEAITTQGGGIRAATQPEPLAVSKSVATGQPLSPEQEKMLEGLRAAEHSRQQEIARIKEENCQQSRDVLGRLTVKSRIRVRDDDGEYRTMGEDERQERISKAQENIALYCVS